MRFSVFQLSRQGGRENNEDRMGYCYTRDAALFVLADGMGGHPDGEVAAQLALQTMAALFQRDARPQLADLTGHLSTSVMTAHHQIIRHASEHALLDTPRTTVVGAVIQNGELAWVHCGDSRLYLIRRHGLKARTRDHSYAEAKVDGRVSAQGANRNVLFTCLGSTVRPMFDVSGPVRLEYGDRILLCSDGLWSNVPDEVIVHVLSSHPVAYSVPELVELALRNGGAQCDNVTAIALEWEAPDGPTDGNSVFTESQMRDGSMFASTIQTEGFDSLSDDMDDDTIERSIAEINEAIQRSSKRRR